MSNHVCAPQAATPSAALAKPDKEPSRRAEGSDSFVVEAKLKELVGTRAGAPGTFKLGTASPVRQFTSHHARSVAKANTLCLTLVLASSKKGRCPELMPRSRPINVIIMRVTANLPGNLHASLTVTWIDNVTEHLSSELALLYTRR